jgi:hypothetical protein
MASRFLRMAMATVSATIGGLARTIAKRGRPGSPAHRLEPGDVAPDFALQGSDGRIHRLHDLLGQRVVLMWFPKAFTGG